MGFNIVLIEPEIPMNTGNIGRLSLASGSVLHLVKPFGFELSDSRNIKHNFNKQIQTACFKKKIKFYFQSIIIECL